MPMNCCRARSSARMTSSSLACIAAASRFCEFWIRKTIRKVTIVVPVLMTSCQVSEKPNTGPVTAQVSTTARARRKAAGWPAQPAIRLAMRVKILSIGLPLLRGGRLVLPAIRVLVFENESRIALVRIDVLPRLLAPLDIARAVVLEHLGILEPLRRHQPRPVRAQLVA